ncbi:MAG: hypothetical protein WCO16_03410 [bacterium]
MELQPETITGVTKDFETKEQPLEQLPRLMQERHDALKKIHQLITDGTYKVEDIFDFEKTVHADLELIWMKPQFVSDLIGSPEDYQVVIAKVQPHQTSDAHLHEVGSSSFIVLGSQMGFANPGQLLYRTGYVDFQKKAAVLNHQQQCAEGLELDIPSNQIHQFENKSEAPAHILIVTHPIISVKEGDVDIHFVDKNN